MSNSLFFMVLTMDPVEGICVNIATCGYVINFKLNKCSHLLSPEEGSTVHIEILL